MAYTIDQQDYYFGAALALFLNHNEDSIPSLIDSTKETRWYELTSDTSPTFLVYMKHSENCTIQERTKALSWFFTFSDKEQKLISKYINEGKTVFIFFVCSEDDFKNTKIVVLTQAEYLSLQGPSLRINWEMKDKRRKQSFTIPNGGKPLSIECNRIEKKLTDI